VRNSDVLDVTEFERSVFALDQSVVNMGFGAEVNNVFLKDQSTLNINGGLVKRLSLWGDASLEVASGTISALSAFGDSRLKLSNVQGLDFLMLNGNAQVEIAANDVAFDGEFLSGQWGDGSYFNIKTFNRTGVQANGLPGYMTLSSPAAVPIPAAGWLFSSAFLGLVLIGRTRRASAFIN
jgi:hypothetical protein